MEESINILINLRKPDCKFIEIIGYDISEKEVLIKINNIIIQLETEENNNFVIIVYTNYDKILQNIFNQIKPIYFTKIFLSEELMVSPITNKCVPKHILCSEDEIYQNFKIKDLSVLPKINIRDVIVRWNGWNLGDVIKIFRSDGSIYYRLVTE